MFSKNGTALVSKTGELPTLMFVINKKKTLNITIKGKIQQS
jgi:hypothetical protein